MSDIRNTTLVVIALASGIEISTLRKKITRLKRELGITIDGRKTGSQHRRKKK